jgi:hypothetical protein
MANLRLIITALNKASGEINKVKNEIEGVGKSGKTAEKGVKGFGSSLSSVIGTAALVTGAVASVGLAIREVYEDLKEGAELEYTRTKFDNLAESIGIVSDALLVDLREATRGTVSDAELVAGAANFMALGLADTHDEVVRLTRVAGALGMNMNQLVLTLTNQTTMRFDALGVSVEGFDEKVKALEASGLSAQEAFSEAFLQQAEEQIERVGDIADTSAGKIMTMESAFKNLGDAIKLSFSDSLDQVAPTMATLADGWAQNITLGTQMTEIIGKIQDAMKSGIITSDEYDNIIKEISGTNGLAIPTTEQLTIAQNALNEIYRDSIIAADQTAESMIAQSIAAKQAEEANKKAATAQQEVADATNNADAAMRSYSESLLFKIASEGLSAEAAYDLAVKMGLVDQNTVAATKQVNIYKQLLDDGIITQAQYNKLVKDLAEDIENLPEGKRLEIDHNIDEVMADLAELERRKIDRLPVILELDTSAVDNYRPPTKIGTVRYNAYYEQTRAVGGAVQGGAPYTWQEYGYRGELFVPSADGFIMSRADAERALSKALAGGVSGKDIDADEIGRAIADALMRAGVNKSGNVYNLTMPTSSNPADVKTAFELMEAWA